MPRSLVGFAALLSLVLMFSTQGKAVELSLLGGYRLDGTFPSSSNQDGNTSTTTSFRAQGGGQFGLAFDTHIDTDWMLGLSWDRQETTLDRMQSNTATDVSLVFMKIDYYHANATKLFDGERWVPFLNAGLGVTHFNPHGEYNGQIRMSWNFSGGIRYEFNETWGLRALARVRSTLTPDAGAFFCSAGGSCVNTDQLWMWQGDAIGGVTFRFGL